MRIGIGYDVHALVEGRQLVVGGVNIPYEKGLLGHSDADVLVHAIMDSILGALALGDIGKIFPDTDNAYKDIDSCILLERVMNLTKKEGYIIGNVDSVIVAQRPKMAPYIETMKEKLSKIMQISEGQLNIKATTTEWLGFEGREEGVSAYSVCVLIADRSKEE